MGNKVISSAGTVLPHPCCYCPINTMYLTKQYLHSHPIGKQSSITSGVHRCEERECPCEHMGIFDVMKCNSTYIIFWDTLLNHNTQESMEIQTY